MVIRVAVARATGKLGSIVGDLVADDPELERLIRCSQYFKSECIEHGIPCLEICERFDLDELVAEAEKLMGL